MWQQTRRTWCRYQCGRSYFFFKSTLSPTDRETDRQAPPHVRIVTWIPCGCAIMSWTSLLSTGDLMRKNISLRHWIRFRRNITRPGGRHINYKIRNASVFQAAPPPPKPLCTASLEDIEVFAFLTSELNKTSVSLLYMSELTLESECSV